MEDWISYCLQYFFYFSLEFLSVLNRKNKNISMMEKKERHVTGPLYWTVFV